MTLAIPFLGPDATELRYCLRSYQQYFNITELFIIGPQPQGLINYTHIPFKDDPRYQWAHRNVWEKLNLVETDCFLWSADDVYIQTSEILPWSPGLLRDELPKRQTHNPYHTTLQNTLDALDPDAIAYNTHAPMWIKRDRLRSIDVDWQRPHGYCIKTLYGQKLQPVTITDAKLQHRQPVPQSPFFSSSPGWIRAGGWRILEKMFPRKSKWEK